MGRFVRCAAYPGHHLLQLSAPERGAQEVPQTQACLAGAVLLLYTRGAVLRLLPVEVHSQVERCIGICCRRLQARRRAGEVPRAGGDRAGQQRRHIQGAAQAWPCSVTDSTHCVCKPRHA